jgi:hypothetical protein
MRGLKSLSLTLASLLTLSFASCGSSGGSSPNEIEVVFRDRTEKNLVVGDFQISLNDDAAKAGVFEKVTVFPVVSKLKVGDLLKFEFFGVLEGVLNATVVGTPETRRVVIEVRDTSIDFFTNDWLELDGSATERVYVDQDVALKKSLTVAKPILHRAISDVESASKNFHTSSDLMSGFNSDYSRRRHTLYIEISELEKFVLAFPTLSDKSEALLSLVREQSSLTGLIAVSNSIDEVNTSIDSLNLLSPKISDAEFRLFGAIDEILNN